MKVEFPKFIPKGINSQNQNPSKPNERNIEPMGVLTCYELMNNSTFVHLPLISFGMLKKSNLNEYQLAFVNKFRAPLEKFKTKDYFDTWALKKLEEKTDLGQYKNEEPVVQEAVRTGLNEWKNYLCTDSFYKKHPTLSLIIFDAITKDISHDTHSFPPELHKGVLSSTVEQLKARINYDPKSIFDFDKNYQNNLRLEYSKDLEDVGDGNYNAHWVRIPSKKHDYENFEENVKKLKALSCKSWCTRATHAEDTLENGDFYIYLEQNKPKVGIKFYKNEIVEIQGEKNNQRLPLNHLDEIKSFVKKNNFKFHKPWGMLEESLAIKIEKAEKGKTKIDEIKMKYANDLKEKRYDKILNSFGLNAKILKDEFFELDKFYQPENITFEELGLDENKLFEKVTTIKGLAKFSRSEATKLVNLQHIYGNAYFDKSKIKDLGNLKYIKGDAYFNQSRLESLGNLESIGGYAWFEDSNIIDLGHLEFIGECANFQKSKVKTLGMLRKINGHANFEKSEIIDLGELVSIEGNGDFSQTKLTNLGKLRLIRGHAYFPGNYLKDLGNLEYIGRNLYLSADDLNEITGNVKYIGGDVYLNGENIDKSSLPFYHPIE